MAKDLSAQQGVQTDANYLNGKIANNQSLVGEGINQDMVQFFQKMMDIAGLSPNGNFDNEANNYQFVQALAATVHNFDVLTVGALDDGPFNLDIFTGYVNATRRDVSNGNQFILPASDNLNRGRVVVFDISTQDQAVTIDESGGGNIYTVTNPGTSHRQQNERVIVMSTGSTWEKINTDPIPWVSGSTQNSWAGTIRYRLLPDFKVEFEVFDLQGVSASGQTFETLSPPYRPTNDRIFAVARAGGDIRVLRINADGSVTLNAVGESSTSDHFEFKVSYYTK